MTNRVLKFEEHAILHLVEKQDGKGGITRSALGDQLVYYKVTGDKRDAVIQNLIDEGLLSSRKLRNMGKPGPRPTKYIITDKGKQALKDTDKAGV